MGVGRYWAAGAFAALAVFLVAISIHAARDCDFDPAAPGSLLVALASGLAIGIGIGGRVERATPVATGVMVGLVLGIVIFAISGDQFTSNYG